MDGSSVDSEFSGNSCYLDFSGKQGAITSAIVSCGNITRYILQILSVQIPPNKNNMQPSNRINARAALVYSGKRKKKEKIH